ncbi:MAG: alpha/beta fold hydrolase [Flavobacteriaceae bacterium]|nr:alpha/beta fold hydrolase [Flavobacteriaceae bacterium]
MIYRLQYISLFSFLLSIYTLTAQVNKPEDSTKNIPISLKIENDTISVYALLAKGNEKKETVILLHGLPGHERNLDIAQELRRNGKNVIFFNYRGAWGSQGDFLYTQCIEDVGKILDFLSKPENAETYKIKPDAFVLFGHSMGGGIALLAGANDSRVQKIAVYSPYLLEGAAEESLNGAKSYFESLFMLNINFPEFKKDILSSKDQLKVLNFKQGLSQKHLLILDENERNKHWIDQLDNVEFILMETDHSFSDRRLELTDRVIKWIDM